jgi:Flp pilus assembly protein TadG
MRAPGRDESGNAVVEFVWLAVLLMVPLVYVVLTAASLQRAAFGLTGAAREGGRAYATAGSDSVGERRAEQAIALALRDEGVAWAPTGRVVSCGDCDFSPGSTFTVSLSTTVKLPVVPGWMCGRTCVAGVVVSARHTEQISCYAGTGVPDPGGTC